MVTARLRRLRRNPLLAAHHLATIGLGMAAVTAVVSLMLAIAYQPLPFSHSAQLVEVWNRVESGASVDVSGEELIQIQEATTDLFAFVGGFYPLRQWLFDGRGGAQPMTMLRLEERAFRALDLAPVRGAPLSDRASKFLGAWPIWISHELWQSRYGGSPSVVGAAIRLATNDAGLQETPAVIAGVMPPDTWIPRPGNVAPVDLWSVLPDGFTLRVAKTRAFVALGRLRPGRMVVEAQAALTALADRRPRPEDRRYQPVVRGLEEIAYGPARRTAGVLALGVALVLLLALANLTSLTVAEGSRRQFELSIQTSLGASRWRLWREIVTEHLVLTVAALALGVAFAFVLLRGLTRLVAMADLGPPLSQPPSLNLSVMLGFSVCALAATFVWSSLIVRGAEIGGAAGVFRAAPLSGSTRLRAVDRRAGLMRLGALAVQACLGIALMVLAVSMARVYVRLTEMNLGPAPERTAFFRVGRALGGAPTDAQATEFNTQALALVRRLPDVQATAFANIFPPFRSPMSFWKQDDPPDAPRATTYPQTVSNDYFSTLGIPILYGRGFDGSDRLAGKAVAVIDVEMARRNWPAAKDAVNAQISIGASKARYEVIGVAGSFGGYWSEAAVPAIYLAQSQHPSNGGVIVFRSASSTAHLAEPLRQLFAGMPEHADISSLATMQAGWQATATRPRARMAGMLLLALIGVALGAQGIYALAVSTVAARRHELAIRTALGASGPALVWLVLRQLVVAVTIGSGVGVLGVITVQRLAPRWISAGLSDPAGPIALAVAVLLATVVLGGVVPARSATRATSVAWLRR